MGFLAKVRLLWHIFLHKDAPWSVKLLLLAGFFYLIFPLDVIPDHIVLAGWVDDVALAILMYILALKYTPEKLISKILDHKKHRDEQQKDRPQ